MEPHITWAPRENLRLAPSPTSKTPLSTWIFQHCSLPEQVKKNHHLFKLICFLWIYTLKWILLDHMEVLFFLTFSGTSWLFPMVAESIYIPTNSVQEFSYPHILPNTYLLTTAKKYTNSYVYLFVAALFTITKIWKQPKCPSKIDQQMNE